MTASAFFMSSVFRPLSKTVQLKQIPPPLLLLLLLPYYTCHLSRRCTQPHQISIPGAATGDPEGEDSAKLPSGEGPTTPGRFCGVQ